MCNVASLQSFCPSLWGSLAWVDARPIAHCTVQIHFPSSVDESQEDSRCLKTQFLNGFALCEVSAMKGFEEPISKTNVQRIWIQMSLIEETWVQKFGFEKPEMRICVKNGCRNLWISFKIWKAQFRMSETVFWDFETLWVLQLNAMCSFKSQILDLWPWITNPHFLKAKFQQQIRFHKWTKHVPNNLQAELFFGNALKTLFKLIKGFHNLSGLKSCILIVHCNCHAHSTETHCQTAKVWCGGASPPRWRLNCPDITVTRAEITHRQPITLHHFPDWLSCVSILTQATPVLNGSPDALTWDLCTGRANTCLIDNRQTNRQKTARNQNHEHSKGRQHCWSHHITHIPQKLTTGPQKCNTEVLPRSGTDLTVQSSQQLEQKSHMDIQLPHVSNRPFVLHSICDVWAGNSCMHRMCKRVVPWQSKLWKCVCWLHEVEFSMSQSLQSLRSKSFAVWDWECMSMSQQMSFNQKHTKKVASTLLLLGRVTKWNSLVTW